MGKHEPVRAATHGSHFQTSTKTRLHHIYYVTSYVTVYGIIVRCQLGVVSRLRRLGTASHDRTRGAYAEVVVVFLRARARTCTL